MEARVAIVVVFLRISSVEQKNKQCYQTALQFLPLNSPSPHQKSESLQVSLECRPESWCHPVLILGIAILPRRLLQRLQVAVPSRSVRETMRGEEVVSQFDCLAAIMIQLCVMRRCVRGS